MSLYKGYISYTLRLYIRQFCGSFKISESWTNGFPDLLFPLILQIQVNTGLVSPLSLVQYCVNTKCIIQTMEDVSFSFHCRGLNVYFAAVSSAHFSLTPQSFSSNFHNHIPS